MVESNKILTVSYGTFSCTLEGFDDAFDTMKAIAEYFRDLAADDRYFGAEPPTPDAEMLARIAERSTARRVEAHASQDGVVLRSGAAMTAPAAAIAAAPVAADPVAEPAPVAEPVVAEAEVDADPEFADDTADISAAIDDTIASDQADAEAAALIAAEAEAAELAAAIAAEKAAAEATAELEAEADVAADEDAFEADYDAAEDHDDEDEVAEVEADHLTEEQADDLADEFAEDLDEDDFEDLAEAAVEAPEVDLIAEEPVADDADDSILSKLRRIRAVVSRSRSAAPVMDYEEDQHAEELAANADVDMTELHEATVSDAADDFVAESDADEYEEVEASVDALEEHAESLTEAFAAADEDDIEATGEAYEDEGALGEVIEETTIATGWARVVKVKRADLEAAVASDITEEDHDDRRPVSSLTPEQEADLQSELAALEAEIDADAAFEDGDLSVAEAVSEEAAFEEDDLPEEELAFAEDDLAEDEIEDDHEAYAEDEDEDAEWVEALAAPSTPAAPEMHEDEARDEGDDSLFTDDDEFDGDDEGNDSLFSEGEAAPAAPVGGRAKLAASASPNDMDRILKETNNQLGETEGTRRRSAIAHLRAAVAATKAEKQAGSDLNPIDEDSTDAYRQDLAQVVRPRRPRPSGTPLRRSEDKPAPLRLVAEQRVDMENQHSDPVRPRRVSIADLIRQEAESDESNFATAEASAAPNEGFAAFIEEAGASELGEVLEAAAAYLAFVEGREQFSRPQLMSRVREAAPEDYSREDALRAFGTLLRDGKIRKVKGGRFTASDRISYRPDQRAVG
ncbi:hypothetical protein [Pseudooceanicola sp.]|uniref:hypothetical protein n=1 Tax=Pseudooceanicola sp. TaxID=1914328 RepID=UPI0026153478|nr:hypothetical protein [Pseudooceanicola sp.]MDF1856239.1 hypothetical protein [Pseudooceanicola sp.]